jgi:hypothetical protein
LETAQPPVSRPSESTAAKAGSRRAMRRRIAGDVPL